MGRRKQGPYEPVYLPYWVYLRGTTVAVSAQSAATVVVPGNGVTIVEIDAEDTDLYVDLLGHAATTGAPIFIAQNGARIIGPLDYDPFPQISILGSGAGFAHISYWRQVIDRGP